MAAVYDKSIKSFARRMQILGMFKGDQKLTASVIHSGLSGTGDDVTMRSVQRGLEMLTDGGYLELVNPGAKPLRWRWPKSKKSINSSCKFSCDVIFSTTLINNLIVENSDANDRINYSR